MKRLTVVLVALLVPFVLGTGAYAAPPSPVSTPVPFEETRFARVAAELAKDPLYVDLDLADIVRKEERASIKAAMTRTSRTLGVPVYFVAIPNDTDSESYGRNGVFLAGLHTHLRRDGLYLMVDDDGRMEAAAYGVPRRLSSYFIIPSAISRVPDYREPFTGLASRVTRALDAVAAEPAGPPVTEAPDAEEIPPFGQERPPLEAEFWGPFLAGLLLVGPLAAFLLYGLALLSLKLWGRRSSGPGAQGRQGRRLQPARPSARWLRSTADKELEALAGELDADRPHMVRAYDAARILRDDVASRDESEDADAFLDLVGVIVVARQGRSARTAARPQPQCFVNPLHGPAGRSRRRIGAQGRFPVCDRCASGDIAGLTLRVPDGRAHYEVPGRWRRSAFGARRPDLAAETLESLGVDS